MSSVLLVLLLSVASPMCFHTLSYLTDTVRVQTATARAAVAREEIMAEQVFEWSVQMEPVRMETKGYMPEAVQNNTCYNK